MQLAATRRRLVAVAAITTASVAVFALPSITSAAAPARPEMATTTTSDMGGMDMGGVTTTTTTRPATTVAATTSKAAVGYEVVAGIFTTKANAQAQIAALKAGAFKQFKIKNIAPKVAVVRTGLTKAQADALAAKINARKTLGKARVKKIS